jgi:hypothetical protein
MNFINVLKGEHIRKVVAKVQTETKEIIVEAKETKKPEEILRGAGFKIKLITPTSFGTQIDFAKQYDPESIKNVLNSFNIKIKGNSVFIVD